MKNSINCKECIHRDVCPDSNLSGRPSDIIKCSNMTLMPATAQEVDAMYAHFTAEVDGLKSSLKTAWVVIGLLGLASIIKGR